MNDYIRGDYVLVLRPNGDVLTAGRITRRRPDGRYKVRKSGTNQVVTVPNTRLEPHPLNGVR